MNKVMMLGILLLFAGSLVSAVEPTHQFIKQYMDPMYRQNLDDGTQYPYTLVIGTPDGITDIVSAMLTLQVWHNPTVTYFITVNGQTCNTEEFLVHTTYAGAGEGTIYFDCSNVITGEGTYDVLLWTDDDTGASTFWADITYSNKPKATLEVHGTEYFPGQRAKLWVQLLDSTGDAIIDGACQIDIYDPNNGVFIENAAMTNMGHDGIYTYDLISPQAQGVYPAIAKCYYHIETTSEFADGFTLTAGTIDRGDYTDTWTLNGDEHKIKQSGGDLEMEYNIDNMCGLTTAEDLLTGMDIVVNAKWKDTVLNDDITISVYNHTSSTWLDLPNGLTVPNDRITVTNFIESNNFTRDGLVDSSGTLDVRFKDTPLGADKKIELDLLEIQCVQLSNPEWTEVKGSSEMHISSDHYWIIDISSITMNVTDESYEGYAYLDFTVSSQTSHNETDQEVHQIMPVPFPCHHILDVTTDGSSINWTGYESGSEACDVYWEMDLEKGTNYDMQIKTENWWKIQIYSWEAEIDMLNDYIDSMCRYYASENGLPDYVLPKTERINHTYDNFYRTCYNTLDYYHHLNASIHQEYLFGSAVFDYHNIQTLNANWNHVSITKDQYLSQANGLIDSLGLATDMSVLRMTGNHTTSFMDYWANVSSTWKIYQQTNATMTGLANVSIDTSGIAQAVWDYAGTPATGLLDIISANIWSTTARTLTSFNLWEHSTASDYVWNNTNRSLTLSPFDPTTIATAVWASPARSLTSFDFLVGLNSTALSDIWSYMTRGLTEQVDVDWATGSDYVWNNTNKTLSEAPFDPAVISSAVWTYASRNLTYTEDVFNYTALNNNQADLLASMASLETSVGNVDEYVWNFTNRTLSDAPFDPALIAEAVWAYTNRNLTYLDWQAGSNVIWNDTDRQLTGFDFVVDATINETSLVFEVWNAATRELTASPFDPAEIWNYTDRQLTAFTFTVDTTLNESEISTLTADQVWNYYNRSLTEIVDVDLSSINTTILAGDIWNYDARYTHGVELN